MSDNILSYIEMCQREGLSLQAGMNFGVGGTHSVILMSLRPNAPYRDLLDDGGTTLIYEGHDQPRGQGLADPKLVDQVDTLESGNLTQNGKFQLGAGVSQTTAADGSYALYGIAGIVTVRARKPGYVDRTQQASVVQDQMLDFTLAPIQAPVGVKPGPYQVTFIAAPSCTQLPDDVRTRSYVASLTQVGARLDVTFRGPGLNGGTSPTETTVTARVVDTAVTFQLTTDYYYYYYHTFSFGPGILLEQLSPTRYVSVFGTATGTISSAGIAGMLVGSFVSIDAPNGLNRSGMKTTTCTKGDHQFAFSSGMTTTSKRIR